MRRTFDAVLADSREGGQLCVFYRGKKVVDLWGGCMDRSNTEPCTATTLVPVFSATKGAAALVVAMLVEEGLVDLNAPIAKFW